LVGSTLGVDDGAWSVEPPSDRRRLGWWSPGTGRTCRASRTAGAAGPGWTPRARGNADPQQSRLWTYLSGKLFVADRVSVWTTDAVTESLYCFFGYRHLLHVGREHDLLRLRAVERPLLLWGRHAYTEVWASSVGVVYKIQENPVGCSGLALAPARITALPVAVTVVAPDEIGLRPTVADPSKWRIVGGK
jgi:hypothetical protein